MLRKAEMLKVHSARLSENSHMADLMTQEFGNRALGQSKLKDGPEYDWSDRSEIFGHEKINK